MNYESRRLERRERYDDHVNSRYDDEVRAFAALSLEMSIKTDHLNSLSKPW